MSSILQLSAMSRMSYTKTESPFTFLRIQFITMTSAAKHVHVIEVPQPVRIRSSVMSSLKFPARSSSLHPRENVVQHAVSLFVRKRRWRDGQIVSSLESGSSCPDSFSGQVLVLCPCTKSLATKRFSITGCPPIQGYKFVSGQRKSF